MKSNCVKHIRTAPYHPSSNGLAERFVQTFKRAMKTGEKEGSPVSLRLAQFLLTYRSTPHATTNTSNAELFLGRIRLDLLKPSLETVVNVKQANQKLHHDSHSKARHFSSGQAIMARVFTGNNKWLPGTIMSSLGPLSYQLTLENGKIIKRHIDHLRQRPEDLPQSPQHIEPHLMTLNQLPVKDQIHHCPNKNLKYQFVAILKDNIVLQTDMKLTWEESVVNCLEWS